MAHRDGQIEIIKGVPVPEGRAANGSYPYDKLKVGECFFVPKDDRDTIRIQSNLMSGARSGRFGAKRFKSQVIRQGHALWKGKDGVAVWRVA